MGETADTAADLSEDRSGIRLAGLDTNLAAESVRIEEV
jgi:hypothetical protein